MNKRVVLCADTNSKQLLFHVKEKEKHTFVWSK